MKLNFIAAWQVTCGGQKAGAITKRLLIKQTKLQLTYLCISILTLNKFKPGIQAYISLQEWQTTVTRGVYINSFSDSLHGRIGQKKMAMLKLFEEHFKLILYLIQVKLISRLRDNWRVVGPDAITKRLLIKQTKVQLTFHGKLFWKKVISQKPQRLASDTNLQ